MLSIVQDVFYSNWKKIPESIKGFFILTPKYPVLFLESKSKTQVCLLQKKRKEKKEPS